MNILPLVIIIIMIFSLSIRSATVGQMIDRRSVDMYHAFFQKMREAHNDKERRSYDKYIQKNKKPKNINNDRCQSKNSEYALSLDFRNKNIGTQKGRLNLFPLLTDPEKWGQLRIIVSAYIQRLYGHTEMFSEDSEHMIDAFLDVLVDSYRHTDYSAPFYLLPLPQPWRFIFHKLLKGTKTYSIDQCIGYPPFEDVFTVNSKSRVPVSFMYANSWLLSAILGDYHAAHLMDYERYLIESPSHTYTYLDRNQIERLLHGLKDSSVLDVFEYSKRAVAVKLVKRCYSDPNTRVVVDVAH